MARFVARLEPPEGGREPAYWFVFQGDQLLVRPNGDSAEVPRAADLSQLGIAPGHWHYLGYLEDEQRDQIDCYAAEIAPDAPLPQGLVADGLRPLYPRIGELLFGIAGRAVQIVEWDHTHRYCGRCGTPTEDVPHERAKRCPACGLVGYPRLSPAIIIAVVRHTEQGDRLLLARNHRFPPDRYSVLAGYVEPGETLEECARREVWEEVGIRIQDVRYFGSQPWPFPHSLMIAFIARYAGGDIRVDGEEIVDARWFTPEALPTIPPPLSIARQMIDAWVTETAVGSQ